MTGTWGLHNQKASLLLPYAPMAKAIFWEVMPRIVRSLSDSDCDKLALKAQVLEANALTCGTIACSMSYITTVCLKWAFACH